MDKEKLTELIMTLIAERDELIQQANARVAFLNGKIEAIQELIVQVENDAKTDDSE